MNIYVGNLGRSVTEDTLRKLFETYGQVLSIKIIKDKFTGEPRGFAFVDMPDNTQAQQAITELNGHELDRQNLKVNEARAPEARGPRPGGNGGGSRFGGPRSGGSSRPGGSSGSSWGSRSNSY